MSQYCRGGDGVPVVGAGEEDVDGRLDDVADAVEFLLGDKARSMSGTVLTVDAGATA